MKSYGSRIAVAIDQLFNALFGGDEDETISSRAYKAHLEGRLWGSFLYKLLNFLDKNHCENSVEWDEGEKVIKKQYVIDNRQVDHIRPENRHLRRQESKKRDI